MKTNRFLFANLLFASAVLWARPAFCLDPEWVFCVQLTATVQTNPPSITLNWPLEQGNAPGYYVASGYAIYRKTKTGTSWGSPIATVGGTTTSYTDFNVSVGGDYEYQVLKTANAFGSFPYTGYGYLYSGINVPMIESRGTIVIVVETNATAILTNELARLKTDLIGDGWQIITHGVSSNDTPASVKALVSADYNADPTHVTALFLIGHIPILESGELDYDGHGARPMPADAYYGDMTGNWSSLPGYIPGTVMLEIGRADMFDLPGATATIPYPDETELLRNYLNKDHAWRVHGLNVPRRALMADRFGNSQNGEPNSVTGYRSFAAFVGFETNDPLNGDTFQADVSDGALPQNRWISMLTNNVYLWTYACGGGFDTGMSEMGLHGQYNDVWSTDIVNEDAKAVFYMQEGSHFGNWDASDDLERSDLATPSLGLGVASLAGHPHWFIHHMGLGETIGYGTRLTMNNTTFYQTWSNNFMGAVYIAWLGDPALRLEPVAPVSNLTASSGGGSVGLGWNASSDSVAGYYVYRSATSTGPFTRLTPSLLAGTSFTDTSAVAGSNYTYMVRAVALQTNPSGSYYDPSEGVFITVTDTISGPPPTITVSAQSVPGGLQLTWNSQATITYHVLASSDLAQTHWTDVSGSLTAGGSTTVWTDTNVATNSQRFYRITSP